VSTSSKRRFSPPILGETGDLFTEKVSLALPILAHDAEDFLSRFLFLVPPHEVWYCLPVTTLAEIETAADALSAAEQQQLLLYLAARLQAQRVPLPESPALARERVGDWMAEDEAAMRRFRPSA